MEDEYTLKTLQIVQEKGCVAPEYTLEDLVQLEYIKFGEPTKRIKHHHYRLTELGKVILQKLLNENEKPFLES